MSKYAIVQIGPFQYTLEEKKSYSLPKFADEAGKLELTEVLAVSENDNIQFGNPNVSGAKVVLKVEGVEKGKKTVTRQFKAKSRYRRTIGHRAELTKFVVESISTTGGAKASKAVKKTEKTK